MNHLAPAGPHNRPYERQHCRREAGKRRHRRVTMPEFDKHDISASLEIARCVRGCTTDAQYTELTGRIAAALRAADKAGAERLREAAADAVTDHGTQPCDCATLSDGWWNQNCDCHNWGNLASAQSWCSSMNAAIVIRALPVEPPP